MQLQLASSATFRVEVAYTCTLSQDYSHIRIKRGGHINRGWSYKNPKNANGVGLYKVNSLHIKRGWPYKNPKNGNGGAPFNTDMRVTLSVDVDGVAAYIIPMDSNQIWIFTRSLG